MPTWTPRGRIDEWLLPAEISLSQDLAHVVPIDVCRYGDDRTDRVAVSERGAEVQRQV